MGEINVFLYIIAVLLLTSCVSQYLSFGFWGLYLYAVKAEKKKIKSGDALCVIWFFAVAFNATV